jgi:uncharacterized protein (TIGR03435 family)
MLQALLQERCKLKVHKETRLLPVYTLLTTRGGAKLQRATEEGISNCVVQSDPPTRALVCQKTPILGLVNALANMLHNSVIDKTGLSGAYDFTLAWEAGNDDFASILPDALEGMGLRIDTKKNLTEVMVVDSAERPSGN